MDSEREDQEFERQEDERLRKAFERYDSLHKGKGPASYIPGEEGIAEGNGFEEDEYEYIIDKYVDLYNIEMANSASEEGFQRYPYSSALLVRYCDAMVIRKELDKALDILDHYKDSFPPNADIYLSYSRVYIGKKDLESARRYYEMAIAVESTPEDVCDSVHTLAQDCVEIEE